MNMPISSGFELLVIDDEPDLCTLYELTLVREGYAVETAATLGDAWALLQKRSFDLIITDMRLPDGMGLSLIQRIEAAGRREKTIVITAYGSAENAVDALKAGAYDYLTKPVDMRQFRWVVASALGRKGQAVERRTAASSSALTSAATQAQASCAALARMAGQSGVMSEVRTLIGKVSRSMAPVLVNGESGTGKELVARAIHEVGSRASRPFIAVNCGAIPEQLLEAEFFGYRKGAFTGAAEDREGFFQAASGGTLFLDEIGDLPLAMQSKLLRVIQERAVRPIGATSEQSIDVRILSATHKNLATEVQAGRFRQDLYYRLNVIQISVPPLRQRREDLAAICNSLLARIARDAGAPLLRLSDGAWTQLRAHTFPGNVRELENLLHRAVAMANGPEITIEDLGLPPLEDSPEDLSPAEITTAPEADALSTASPAFTLPSDLAHHLDDIERDLLTRALREHRNNRTAAGAALGLSLRQMRYRMARLGIQIQGETPDLQSKDFDAGGLP